MKLNLVTEILLTTFLIVGGTAVTALIFWVGILTPIMNL